MDVSFAAYKRAIGLAFFCEGDVGTAAEISVAQSIKKNRTFFLQQVERRVGGERRSFTVDNERSIGLK